VLPDNTDVIGVPDSAPYRPRLSRETRRLLATALVAVLSLWALARVRFPDRPPTPNPVPPILDQLTGPPTFADLAARVADLRAQLTGSVVAVELGGIQARGDAARGPEMVAALRIRDDLGVAVIAPAARRAGAMPVGIVAEDRGSGLTLVQTSMKTRPTVPIFWSPRDLEQPRYVLASAISPRDISLRPAFIGSLTPVELPQWSGPVWALPMDAAMTPGALLFTEQGELVGVVAAYDGGLAIVPARMLVASAEQLLEAPRTVPADLGVEVATLTAPLASAAGADSGVVVAWVDPSGAAATLLRAGDVISSIDGVEITGTEQWRVRAARVVVGSSLTLGVTRSGLPISVPLSITAPVNQTAGTLGLVMRPVADIGAEVMRVNRGSAADAAGVLAGDVITTIGSVTSPTPAQVRSAFASIKHGDRVILAVTRGGAHRVMAIQR
jgi:hypothetical protein